MVGKNITTGTSNFYVYGTDMVSQGGPNTTDRQYYLTDGLGNVKYLTSSTGTTLNTYSYDPYGGNQTTSGSTANNYAYKDEQKDAESGLVYLRARYYDPSTVRFTSVDVEKGLLTNPASQNGYNYSFNNPVMLSDPSGHFPTIAIGAILGAAVGGIGNGISYAVTTHNFNIQDLGANIFGGAVSGAINGACLGSGAELFLSAGCGAAGGVLGDAITQSLDTRAGISASQLAIATGEGAAGGLLGGIGSAKINPGWLALANRNPGGLSGSNLLPWATTGSLGSRLQYNNLVGNAWGAGVGIASGKLANCSWGGL